jgi:hypothetical protein
MVIMKIRDKFGFAFEHPNSHEETSTLQNREPALPRVTEVYNKDSESSTDHMSPAVAGSK